MSGVITVIAPINIAVIKYWGKRDEELILPLNDSVSATLDTSVMCAKTSVCAHPDLAENEIWLNGIQTSFNNQRLQNCLNTIKSIAKEQKSVDENFLTWNIRICSENNFPTAAGLASSAAGYACLVTALAKLYKIQKNVSAIARLGSGSACRSMYGGFVRWHAGTNPDGSDSIASQVMDHLHWPEMRVLILVVKDTMKHTSSSKGMKLSVETSELLKHRVKNCVPKRVEEICEAIQTKNFSKFAELTMKDSNQFHAVCLDTYPPCVYMTDVSHRIVDIIHKYNELSGEVKVAYTFDAGPNACLYLLEKDVPEVISLIKQTFPFSNNEFIKGLEIPEIQNTEIVKEFPIQPFDMDLIKYLIYTKVGDGPKMMVEGPHLIDSQGQILNK